MTSTMTADTLTAPAPSTTPCSDRDRDHLSPAKQLLCLHAVQLQRVLDDDDPISFAARLQLVVDSLGEALRAAREAGIQHMRETGEIKIGFAHDGFVYSVQIVTKPRYELKDNYLDELVKEIDTLSQRRKAREAELKKLAQPVDMAYSLRVTAVPAQAGNDGSHHAQSND
jgi:hypothetical protein